MRSSPRDDTAVSAAEMVYGAKLTLPGQLNPSTLSPLPSAAVPGPLPLPPPTARSWAQVAAASTPSHLTNAAFVYVKRSAIPGPLAPAFNGPYRVIRRGPKAFNIAIGDRVEVVSVDRLKPHTGSGAVQPPCLPAQGRPRS